MEKNTLSALIGKNISRQRKELHMTQEKLAERLNVSKQYIAHVEGGDRIFSVPLLRKAAEVLGVSADELLFGQAEICDLDQNILKMLSRRTAAEKETIEDVIRLCGLLCGDGSCVRKLEEET